LLPAGLWPAPNAPEPSPILAPAAASAPKLTRAILDRSLELGTEFLLNAQKPAGNFVYEVHLLSGEYPEGDAQVRQAGALWSLALIHHDQPSERVRQAVIRGLDFFKQRSKVPRPEQRMILYPGDSSGRTGTVALVVLALVDLLRSDGPLEGRDQYQKELGEYLRFLFSLRQPEGQFYQYYDYKSGKGLDGFSPYFDGEALLAGARAAKYAGHSELRDLLLESARRMYEVHVEHALAKHRDSDTTKGFFQWGVMAFHELVTSGWEGGEAFGPYVIRLGSWMIDTHRVLKRPLNTAYAQEGLVSAWEVARRIGDTQAQAKFGAAVDQGLYKLTSWQVGGPLAQENNFLKHHPDYFPPAAGGVMNSKSDPVLRVDVTQHQMHAVILARRYIYQK
jgi:UDP-N-acetylmuramoyl-tripeptide--D-alanyl-D-alanine ligase